MENNSTSKGSSNTEIGGNLSNAKRRTLLKIITDAFLAIIEEKEEDPKNPRKSGYMGDIIENKEYKIKKTKSGEEYYVY